MKMNSKIKTIYIRKMRYEEAKIKLDREINDAFMEGETFIEVVHGIGEGKLKQLTLDYVRDNDFLKLYSVAEFVHQNPGSTKIEILAPSKTELKKLRY
jgi:dsDNA-specific endonuclease/ATPase MutS2